MTKNSKLKSMVYVFFSRHKTKPSPIILQSVFMNGRFNHDVKLTSPYDVTQRTQKKNGEEKQSHTTKY